jgi:intraflagellar transport protein 56
VLERLDPNPEYWEGKRGACIGLFQAVIAGREAKDLLREIISMLRNTSNPQVSAPRLGVVLLFATQE